MPIGRMLNKKVSHDIKLNSLSIESQLIFTWTLPHLDAEGRIIGTPEAIKGTVFPVNDKISIKKIEKSLKELHDAELIFVYGEKRQYIWFPKFATNQSINKTREAVSTIPSPDLFMSNSGVTPEQVKLSKVKNKISKVKMPDMKSGEPKIDFIAQLLETFQDAYFEVFNMPFDINKANAGKERKGISVILQMYKDNNPNNTSDQTKSDLKKVFLQCCRVEDKWLCQNVSPSFISTQWNRYKMAIQKPDQQIDWKEFLDESRNTAF